MKSDDLIKLGMQKTIDRLMSELSEQKAENERLRESLTWFLYASPFQLREAQAIMGLEAIMNPNCPYRKAKEALKEADNG